MKKILLVLAIIMGFSAGANAQVCIISGEKDNVEVFTTKVWDETVDVVVANDSHSISANVTVEVEVTYVNGNGNKKPKKYSGKVTAKPNGYSVISIDIAKNYPDSNYKPLAAKVLKITGTKCR